MDPAGAWGPACGFQLANWPVEEPPAAEAWAPPPPMGIPVEYVPPITDIFGACSLPWPYVPAEFRGEQQLVVEHYYNSAALQHEGRPIDNSSEEGLSDNSGDVIDMQEVTENFSEQQVVDDPQNRETRKFGSNNTLYPRPRDVFRQLRNEFKVDMINLTQEKMHRYPAGLRALDESYTVPRIVSIGPYHHHRDHLKQAEKAKHVAAIECVRKSRCSLLQLYAAVASAADAARNLYENHVIEGISVDDFRHMMFFDACFLVQFMLMRSGEKITRSLHHFLRPNRRDIFHDITLLENQLPWKVVQVVMQSRRLRMPVLAPFISAYKGYLQDQKPHKGNDASVLTLDEDYEPPHLLGLLRYYTVGRISDHTKGTTATVKPKNRSVSISAMELSEIGISLKADKTRELIHMALHQEGTLFAKLSLAPLSLDRKRASYLVNMAALELCTVNSFSKSPVESSAVCSYLLLLAMLVNREEDVHELRARGLLQGGGGLTNQEALSFFTSLQGLRPGRCYYRIMRDIERYKENRRMRTKLYALYNNNKKTIAAAVTGLGAVGGIIATLLSIKKAL